MILLPLFHAYTFLFFFFMIRINPGKVPGNAKYEWYHDLQVTKKPPSNRKTENQQSPRNSLGCAGLPSRIEQQME